MNLEKLKRLIIWNGRRRLNGWYIQSRKASWCSRQSSTARLHACWSFSWSSSSSHLWSAAGPGHHACLLGDVVLACKPWDEECIQPLLILEPWRPGIRKRDCSVESASTRCGDRTIILWLTNERSWMELSVGPVSRNLWPTQPRHVKDIDRFISIKGWKHPDEVWWSSNTETLVL